jgi:hypothetical protein
MSKQSDQLRALVELGKETQILLTENLSPFKHEWADKLHGRWSAALAGVKPVGRPRVTTPEDVHLATARLAVNGKRPSLREVARELRVSKSTVARLLK